MQSRFDEAQIVAHLPLRYPLSLLRRCKIRLLLVKVSTMLYKAFIAIVTMTFWGHYSRHSQ